MDPSVTSLVDRVSKGLGNDPGRLVDILRAVQAEAGSLSPDTLDAVASAVGVPRVRVEEVASFYSFFRTRPTGRFVIRLSDDVIDRMKGYDRVREAFESELGIRLGETTPDGLFTLLRTACIGLSDQAPAALVNDVPVTELSTDRAREIVAGLREHGDPGKLVRSYGRGNNSHPLVLSMVRNDIRFPGPILFSPEARGEAIRKALSISPNEVIRQIKTARLRGRGGAGFPCGMKWEFARAAEGEPRTVIGNADEGEPGTFKDRVLLTERPDRVFAGMTIAGYAIGAKQGVLYLRAEYAYLKPFLEHVLERRRKDGLLGAPYCARFCVDFDIRIRLGAGSYVCGEESALIESAEGKRGDPRNRPPFPAQRGYLGGPTVVNNVETLCCVAKIMEEGAATFSELGTKESTGTKLLSISGDCRSPGVYEVPFGIRLSDVLGMCGGNDAAAVQVGGPSGRIVGPAEYGRTIAFDDLATGGSIMVFGPGRDLLGIAEAFLEFFADESCGYCAPCRHGNEVLRTLVGRIRAGRGEPADLEAIAKLGKTMRATSRCGLGQTSANPALTSMEAFPALWEDAVAADPDGYRRSFDLEAALAPARRIREGGGR